jgi:hypothetical protein
MFGRYSREGGMWNISADDICIFRMQSYEYAHEYRCSLCQDRKRTASIDPGSDVLILNPEWE